MYIFYTRKFSSNSCSCCHFSLHWINGWVHKDCLSLITNNWCYYLLNAEVYVSWRLRNHSTEMNDDWRFSVCFWSFCLVWNWGDPTITLDYLLRPIHCYYHVLNAGKFQRNTLEFLAISLSAFKGKKVCLMIPDFFFFQRSMAFFVMAMQASPQSFSMFTSDLKQSRVLHCPWLLRHEILTDEIIEVPTQSSAVRYIVILT